MKVYEKTEGKIINLLQNVALDEKSEKLLMKKVMKTNKTIYKDGKKNYKFWWYWNWKIQISSI